MRASDDDRALVGRITLGDATAIEIFVKRYGSKFEWIARSRGVPYPDWQDVAQEAVADALRQMGRFQWECTLGSWLERIVRGHIVNWTRKLRPPMIELDAQPLGHDKRRKEIEKIDELTAQPSQESRTLVREILQGMSPKRRVLLILNVIYGFTGQQIADRLGLSQGTVGRNITEAKEEFRRKFESREKRDGF